MGNKFDINKLPDEYIDIYNRLIMPVDTNIEISSVILSDENAKKITRFIKEYSRKEMFEEYGLRPMNRILMYGASGTGKTYLTKALSNHLNYIMLYVDISKSLTEGNVSKNISEIFKLGDYLGECVLFFDECDSIAWSRDSSTAERGDIRRACNSIFQYLDQMNTKSIFVSATNMAHKLDPAYERRFDLKMHFKKPDFEIKECIKKFIYPKFIIVDDVDDVTVEIIERRARGYAKLSYYEIQNIVLEAMKRAIMNDSNKIRTSEVFSDLATSMGVRLRFDPAKGPDSKRENYYNSGSSGDWTKKLDTSE